MPFPEVMRWVAPAALRVRRVKRSRVSADFVFAGRDFTLPGGVCRAADTLPDRLPTSLPRLRLPALSKTKSEFEQKGVHTKTMKTKLTSITLAAACLALLGATPVSLRAATLIVTNNADSGPGTLRAALAIAADGDTIDASGVTGTITLTTDQLWVSNSVTLLGPGPGALTVSAINGIRVFLVTGTDVTISGLTIANAQGAGYGMGVLTGFGISLALNNCIVTSNSTTLSGGGIFNSAGASLTISDCIISGNSASGPGGGVYNNQGWLTLNQCTLTGNVAANSGGGGAVWNEFGTLTVNQSTLQGNNADNSPGGGGIVNNGGTVTVNQSTLTQNSATASTYNGGGILNSGSLTLSNSIVAGNIASADPEIFSFGIITVLGVNLTNGVPLLAPLDNYGGPTPTMPPLPGSPALDGCTNGTGFTTDQRGLPRIVGPFADIGAVESGNPIPSLMVNTAADENDGLGTNAVSLRDAIAYAPSGSTITFAPALSGATILLTNGQLNVPNSVTLLGPGPGALTVSGNYASRVFNVTGTNVSLSGLTIADGQGNVEGAGIRACGGSGSSVMLDNCVVTNNSSSGVASGGGIYVYPGVTVTVSNCTIAGNSAPSGQGGGACNRAGTLRLVNSTLSGNSAQWGGGVYNEGYGGSATLTVNASTFSGNSAFYYGGGIENDGTGGSAAVTINASTFSGNLADNSGGGAIDNTSGTIAIGDTILKAGASGPNLFNLGSVTSYGYNLSSDTSGSSVLIATGDWNNVNPKLGPLQDNGGPTLTHALLPDSPAIDRGKRDAITNLFSNTDQRGLPRPVDFFSLPSATGGDNSDIGAFEFQKTAPTTVTSTNDSGPGSLREAIACAASGDTIDATGISGTITLTSGTLSVSNNVSFVGPGAGALTVSGNHLFRVFNILGGNVLMSGLTIADAQTVNGGGMFLMPGVTMTIINCNIAGNKVSQDAGGIYNFGTLAVIASTISGNSAYAYGGGICNCGTLTVYGCTFSRNSVTVVGGAIYNDGNSSDATLIINASTFSTNSAQYGGAIENDAGFSTNSATLTVNASTFSGNSASAHGGGIDNWNYTGNAPVFVADSLFNAGAAGANFDSYYGNVISLGHNLSSDGGSGFLTTTGDQTNTSPLLGPLQDNGGLTPTHALLANSPAIDKGDRDAIPILSLNTDQRGLARPVNFFTVPDDPTGDGSDIGAFEFQKTQPPTVTSANDSGPGTLREALAGAANGDTIDATGVAGTITLTNGQLEVAGSVTVLGPGPGTLTVSGNHAARVFNVTGTNVTISGVTIADGYGAGYGTGIKTYGAGTRLTVNNCVLTNNSTTLSGGGIFNDPGVTMMVSNSTLCGNSAPSGSGGGIYNNQGTLTIVQSTFGGNWAAAGGGVFNSLGATMTVSNSTFSGNSANTGGGIYNSNAALTVVASTLSGNVGWLVAGGIMNDGVSGSATLAINASTLSGNSAWSGGGIVNYGVSGNASLTLNASTLNANSASSGFGGGIFNNGEAGTATVQTADTILNAGVSGANIYNYSGTFSSLGYNLSSDAAGGDDTTGPGGLLNATGDIRNTDPLLGPLQDNGGRTWTHALLPGSPAIDQGYANAVPGLGLGTDQCGCRRAVNFAGIPNANGGDSSDIGAFEAQIIPGSSPLRLIGAAKSGSGGPLQFAFTNTPGASFTVFTTTNLALPFSDWTVLGVPIELAPGQFQFTDPQATNHPQGFYRVTSP